MLFNSWTFLIFFLITIFIYYLPPFQKVQIPILIAASFVFYAWSAPALLIVLLISILINAAISFKVARSEEKKERLRWALTGVAINLFILCLFKYGALLTNLFIQPFGADNRPEEGIIKLLLHLPLPIGISFYTFEGIGLLIDVLRQQESKSEESNVKKGFDVDRSLNKHILNTSFFIAFFPHLISGPILKANNFYPQISPKYFRDIPWENVFHSLVVGYFLKMVVADNLKDYTFWITYPYYQGFGTITNLVLLFGYSMQIFADFAGYSLIAIGLGAALGYTLPPNFNFPYISSSIAEFWRRWHISLSNWLRDYLYIPLGGNRKGKVRTYINLIVVMTLGGIWHGAAWSYAVWGLFHGIGLAVERFLGVGDKKSKEKVSTPIPTWKQFFLDSIKVIFVYCFVTTGWLLFKLPNLGEAVDFIATLFKNVRIAPAVITILPVLIFSLPVVLYHVPHFPTFRDRIANHLDSQKSWIWRLGNDALIGCLLALLFLSSGNSKDFIYFQF